MKFRSISTLISKLKTTPPKTIAYEAMGWLGASLFALCAVPQTVQTIQQGHAQGFNWLFLLMWFSGEVLTFFYVLPTKKWALLLNYIFNFTCLCIIIAYKLIGG